MDRALSSDKREIRPDGSDSKRKGQDIAAFLLARSQRRTAQFNRSTTDHTRPQHPELSPSASSNSELSLLSNLATRAMEPSRVFDYSGVTAMPPPSIQTWNEITNDNLPEGEDTWITNDALYTDRHVPGLPPKYEAEFKAGLVVYVRGVPNSWLIEPFKALFNQFGTVLKCPTMISLTSEETFRWVIMSNPEEATRVLEPIRGAHGMKFLKVHLTISRTLAPGRTLALSTPGYLPYLKPAAAHCHPSPQDKSNGNKKEKKENKEKKQNIAPIPVAIPVGKSLTPPVRQAVSEGNSTDPVVGDAATTNTTNTAADTSSLQGVSWANIAGAANPDASVIDLHPESKVSRLQPVGRTSTSVQNNGEPLIEQMRVIFLLNLPANLTTQDISDAITEGPIVRIQFGNDENDKSRYAGIVFQYAKDAEDFHNALMKERSDDTISGTRFKFQVNSVRGEAYPADEVIKAMSTPPYATRRLTMVKKGFFFVLSERQLRVWCARHGGEEKIQLIHAYNGGNATVVFSDVAAAIRVKEEMDRLASVTEPAIWAGLQTTYSKDPCQFPLELKTSLHD